MGKFIKIVLLILLLIIVAVIALPFFIDPNDYKPEIQSVVKEKTGRELTIEGDLELSIFPWLGVSTGNLTISNAAGFADRPFAKIDASNIKVKILPLLSKNLEVSRIELKGLDLYLAKNKQGVSNWDDLAKSDQTNEEASSPDQSKKVSPIASLALGGIAIEQAHIIWDDQQQGQYVEINDFNLTTGKLAFDQPIDIDLAFNLSNKEPELKERFKLATSLIINEKLNLIKLEGVNLESLTTGKAIPGGTLTTALQSEIDIDLTKQIVSVTGLKLNLDDVTEEKLKINLLSDIAIELSSQSIKTSGLQISVDNLIQNKLSAKLVSDIAVNLTQQTLSLTGLKLNAGDLNLTAEINGTHIKDDPSFKGPITVAPFNLAQFLKKLDISLPEMKDSTALNLLSVAFNLQATPSSADMSKLAIKLDDTQINGSINVKNFSIPAIKFDLNLDSIDVGRYMSEQQEEAKPIATPASAAVATAQLFPIDTLRKLNVNGRVKIGTLKKDQIQMKGVGLNINAKKGVIKTQQSIKQLYQGAYSGNASINVQSKTPTLSLDEKLSNIQVEPLFKALDLTDRMTGLVNASIKVKGNGNSTAAIKSSLNGDIDFSFKDSVIRGVNLQKLIDSVRLLIKGKSLPSENNNDQSVLSTIQGTAKITNGLLTNNDLIAESSKMRVKGQGTANLVTEALDYNINAGLLNAEGKDKGVPLVVNIAGSFSDPSYSLDVVAMGKALAGDRVNKAVDKEKDKLIKKLDEKLGPGVGDALKGFF